MENSCDIEDIIPPTPDIQPNKFCTRIDKASITSKLSKKTLKNDQKNFKRKRIISSPDCKTGKQKIKQVTLFNFLVKGNKTTDLASNSNTTNLESPVRKNLLNKFEETGVKNNEIVQTITSLNSTKEICNSENNTLSFISESESKICNEMSLVHLNSQSNMSCNVSFANKNLNSCNPEAESAKQHDKMYGEEKSKDTDKLLSSVSIINNMNSCDTKTKNTEHCRVHNEEKFEDVDQSFLWMSDVDWDKDKENFELSSDKSSDCSMILTSEENICMKFKVKEVEKDSSKNEIRLIIANDNSAVVKNCCLRGFWIDSVVDVGDTVHIIKSLTSKTVASKTVIDNDTGFLVINPDFLISSTAIVSTLFCMRKAVLNYILPQWSPGNNIMMIGSLVHDIFQKSVNDRASSLEEILKIIKSVMKKRENLIALCCQDITESEMEEKICKYIPNIIAWIKKHCSFHGRNTFENISIANVEDIEENIWCPKYGIKGKIDMTVNVNCQNQAAPKIMPLELKTGRPTFSAEHVGQVNLYSLMMEERAKEPSDGLLLYLRDKVEMKVITTNHNSKRGLIQLRNELVSYIYKWVSTKNAHYEEIEECHLPKPINNKRLCEKCPYILPCTVYQKAFLEEKILEPLHAMNTLIPASTQHVTPSYMEYFLHWSRLLLLETTTTVEVKAFWTEDAVKREKQGMCLSYVLLDENVSVKKEAVGGYFLHTFIRSANNPVSSDFKNSCLKEGEYVAISNQKNPDEVAIAMGYIITVSEQFIELAIERNLKALVRLKDLIFRIDKQVSNSAAACVRNNLMLLMQEEDQANKLRKLIIDKEPPKFLQVLPKQIVLLGRSILKCLNKNQQKAVLKALMAEDYFLIKGMPGTGKTLTIVALVRLLVKMNISVLLTSYTHSAIDNILLKLKEHADFVRIGPKYRINPDILEYSFENLTKDFNSVDQYALFMKEKMVVATTCLGINHAIFKLRKFDVCIVDEASQVNQIACLGPLFFAKKFILVGDDKQLPPLVLNNAARQKGMQESLFQRLQNSFNCIELSIQYRMNQEIMRLCNELTYNGSLQCGSEVVASGVLHLENKSAVQDGAFPSWLLSAFDTDIVKSVLFLNVDNYANKPDKSKHDMEADLVVLLVQFLFQFRVHNSDIGIIAPYRKQVDLIQTKLKNLNSCGIEVNTVDQYQGRDKDVVIISCARPSDTQLKTEKTGIILDDEKRLNVAISRAKKKLILIGSKSTLFNYKPFKDLINCLRENQCVDVT